MAYKNIVYIGIFLLVPLKVLLAQNMETVDSLKTELLHSKDDSTKAELYLSLSHNYLFKQNQIALAYSDSAFNIARKRPDSRQKVRIYLNHTDNLGLNRIDSMAFVMLDKATDMNKRLPKKEQVLGFLDFTAALTYQNNYDYPKALVHFQKALDYFESQDSTYALVGAANNCLGAMYNQMYDYDKALEYFNKALPIAQELKHKIDEANILLNIGNTYYSKSYDDTSRYYFKKSLEISREENDPYGETLALINLGNITSVSGAPEEASKLYILALEKIDEHGFVDLAQHILSSLSYNYYNEEKYDSSIMFAQRAKRIGLKQNDYEAISYAFNLISYCLYEQGQTKEAFDTLSYSFVYKDSSNFKNKIKEIATLETKHQYEKILEEERLKEEEEDKAQQKDITELKSISNYLIIALLFAVILVTIQIRSRKKELKHIKELNSKKQEIEIQKIQLESLNQVKNKIFSIISHDLKGPLNSLSSVMHLMQMNGLKEDEFQNLLLELEKKLNSNTNLLDNLLHWAKSQMEGIVINSDTIDLNQLINDNILLFESAALSKSITIENHLGSERYVIADKEMIKLVLRNLISNAIKFSKENTTIEITAHIDDNREIVVAVKDQGNGISSEMKARLFSLELQTTPGTHNEEGTGIGLLLCKDLIVRNGGEIWVDSEIGKGSTFSFKLKAA